MRLERLRITAVGPFAGTEEIDFDALTRGGLFLLEGPTGAGKSTVLDAITFALFGQPAGEATSADRLRSHFAAPGTAPEVQLTFSVGGQRLRITRVPEHERPKKRGGGTTTQKASVHLEKHDGTRWVSVSSTIAEVALDIDQRIRLNRQQFTKVVLLPQGEFATFLRAGAKDRADVLTQIFGTAFYDQLTAQLVAWRRDATRERELADLAVVKAASELGGAAGFDHEQRAVLEAAVAASDDEALSGLETALRAAVDETELTESAAVDRRARAATSLDHLAALRAAYAELADLLARQARHEAEAGLHAERLIELERARAAAPVSIVLRQRADARRQLDRRRDEVVALPLGLTGEETTEDADGFEQLARDWDATAAELRPVASTEAALADRRASAHAFDEAIEAFEEQLKSIGVRRLDLPSLIDDAEAEVARLADLAARTTGLELAHDTAVARLAAATSLLTVDRELAAARARQVEAREARNSAVEHRLELLRRHLDGMAAHLAARLEDGAPCPVCGGTEHPLPAALSDSDVTALELEEAERLEGEAARALDLAAASVAALEARRASLEATADGYDVDTATTQAGAVLVELEVARAGAGALDAARTALAGLRAESEAADRVEKEAREELARLQTLRTQALAHVQRDENTVRLALAEFDSVAERMAALHARAEAARVAAAAVRDLAAARAALVVVADDCAQVCAEAGFADPDQAAAAVRSSAAIEDLAAAVAAWETESGVLAEIAADPRLRDLDPQGADAVLAAYDEASRRHAEAHREVELAAAERTRREQRLAGFVDHRAVLARRREEQAAVHAGTAAIHRIASLANGTSGNPKMTLSTYVLRQRFENVVAAANLRLDRMSSGRYQLERTDEAERKVEQAGLGLRVVDLHTGEVRSPTSLSGGETFYTSLALALGLADVVRAEAGGVDLDTLFIDEGFGTLDTETLELVMDVVDDLRDGGRAVGIVSHVSDLKDQITERLEIRRTSPTGPSTTRVVA